jgi:anthranilate phosphoribosyltransferase
LGVPTIMNLVGPLSNPAGVRRQIIGVADPARAPLMVDALRRLGAEHALIVHGEAGLDEIAPKGKTAVWEVRQGRVTNWTLDPADYGLEVPDLSSLAGGEPKENADRIRSLMSNGKTDKAGRAAVLLNAAAALYVSDLARDLNEGLERAAAAMDDGSAAKVLDRFIAAQRSGANTSG